MDNVGCAAFVQTKIKRRQAADGSEACGSVARSWQLADGPRRGIKLNRADEKSPLAVNRSTRPTEGSSVARGTQRHRLTARWARMHRGGCCGRMVNVTMGKYSRYGKAEKKVCQRVEAYLGGATGVRPALLVAVVRSSGESGTGLSPAGVRSAMPGLRH